MREYLTRLTCATLLMCAVACGNRKELRTPRDPETISRLELMSGTYTTAYDAIEKLHPNWLRLRNAQSNRVVSQIWVYLDGTQYGGTNVLNSLRASTISSIQRIDGPTATIRWGAGHTEGVIYVTTLPQ